MKLFYYIGSLLLLVSSSLANQQGNTDTNLKGKERLSSSTQEEVKPASQPEVSGSMSWAGEHLPLNLREPALEFYNFWYSISTKLEHNPFANFLNEVVEKDGIGVYPTSLRAQEINYEDYFSELTEESKTSLINLSRSFEEPRLLTNPFANYFRGVFTYFLASTGMRKTLLKKQKKAATLLNYASKNHYLRATRFMLEKDLGYILLLERKELSSREDMHLDPLKIITSYVKANPYYSSTPSDNISKLEELVALLPGSTENYRDIYTEWVNELTRQLESSKSIPSDWIQNLSILTLATFSASVLIASAANTLESWDPDHTLAPVFLGTTQGAAGISSLLIGGAVIPLVRNLWSSLRLRDIDGQFKWISRVSLLDNNLSRQEIRDSVRIVVLYSLLYNIKQIKEVIEPDSAQSKRYIRRLRELILSYKYKPAESISKIILKKKLQEFEY